MRLRYRVTEICENCNRPRQIYALDPFPGYMRANIQSREPPFSEHRPMHVDIVEAPKPCKRAYIRDKQLSLCEANCFSWKNAGGANTKARLGGINKSLKLGIPKAKHKRALFFIADTNYVPCSLSRWTKVSPPPLETNWAMPLRLWSKDSVIDPNEKMTKNVTMTTSTQCIICETCFNNNGTSACRGSVDSRPEESIAASSKATLGNNFSEWKS